MASIPQSPEAAFDKALLHSETWMAGMLGFGLQPMTPVPDCEPPITDDEVDAMLTAVQGQLRLTPTQPYALAYRHYDGTHGIAQLRDDVVYFYEGWRVHSEDEAERYRYPLSDLTLLRYCDREGRIL